MQPVDAYESTPQATLEAPSKAKTEAAKEFVTRLRAYGDRLPEPNSGTVRRAVRGVVEEMTSPGPEFDRHRQTLSEDLEPLIRSILEMEYRWYGNVCKAHVSAEGYFAENAEAFETHAQEAPQLVGADKKLEWLLGQRRIIKGWSISTMRGQKLIKLDKDIKRKQTESSDLARNIERRYGRSFFEGLRLYLRGQGFVVSPSYLPPAAVFPRADWLVADGLTYDDLSGAADELIKKYALLGTIYSGLLYSTADPTTQTQCGCLCISWVRARSAVDDEDVFVPFMGLSGGAPSKRNVLGIEAMLAACALPPYTSVRGDTFGTNALDQVKVSDETVFNKYYDDIMARANALSINYRVREFLGLRLPSRQAMLSYVGLSFFVPSRQQVQEHSTEIEPTPGVARWHSFNCAEPAALAWISAFFVDGQDVHLCCPYEGSDDPGAWGLKPKETCPWCATVEIAYRSLRKVPLMEADEWPRVYDASMRTGEWAREITPAQQIQNLDSDKAWRDDLPRNKRTLEPAYPGEVNENVGVLRRLFREVGLLDEDTIRVGLPALWQT